MSSRGKREWILPKGGWESDETQEESAAREAWEEGGVKGCVARHLCSCDMAQRTKPCTIHFFELLVNEVALMWPEAAERARRWVWAAAARRDNVC